MIVTSGVTRFCIVAVCVGAQLICGIVGNWFFQNLDCAPPPGAFGFRPIEELSFGYFYIGLRLMGLSTFKIHFTFLKQYAGIGTAIAANDVALGNTIDVGLSGLVALMNSCFAMNIMGGCFGLLALVFALKGAKAPDPDKFWKVCGRLLAADIAIVSIVSITVKAVLPKFLQSIPMARIMQKAVMEGVAMGTDAMTGAIVSLLPGLAGLVVCGDVKILASGWCALAEVMFACSACCVVCCFSPRGAKAETDNAGGDADANKEAELEDDSQDAWAKFQQEADSMPPPPLPPGDSWAGSNASTSVPPGSWTSSGTGPGSWGPGGAPGSMGSGASIPGTMPPPLPSSVPGMPPPQQAGLGMPGPPPAGMMPPPPPGGNMIPKAAGMGMPPPPPSGGGGMPPLGNGGPPSGGGGGMPPLGGPSMGGGGAMPPLGGPSMGGGGGMPPLGGPSMTGGGGMPPLGGPASGGGGMPPLGGGVPSGGGMPQLGPPKMGGPPMGGPPMGMPPLGGGGMPPPPPGSSGMPRPPGW